MTSSTHQIKVAVIGVGLIGPRHAETVISNQDAKLAAIVDPMPQGQQFAAQLGVPHYNSVKDLVASSDKPDGAIVCTPNHTHVAVGLELVAAGVHVLVEKPVSTDITSGRSLVAAAEAANVRLLVGHHRRFNPYVVATKAAIDSGSIGAITAVTGLWTTFKPQAYFEYPGIWRQTSSSGGVVLINMIHEIDILHHLFGPIIRVYAEKTISRRGFEVEEGAAITLRFASGVVGTFLVSDNVPSPHNFESGTGENPLIPKSGQDFYRIFGTEGTLSVPDMTICRYSEQVEKSWHSELTREETAAGDGVPFVLQLQHFLNVIRGSEETSCTGEIGLRALVVCEALRKSLREETPVVIDF